MASVALRFMPPDSPGLAKLHILEAPDSGGPYNEIEVVTEIGTYPNYISRYTTNLATSVSDWFAIQWEDSKGALSDPSAGVQGDTTTLVSSVLDRMLLRDASLNEIVAAQEAEAAISDYFSVLDPFTVDPSTVSPKVLSGLTNLALARAYMVQTITGSQNAKWTAGIVSMDTSKSTKSVDVVKSLLDLANRDLGRSYSVILLMKEIEVGGGMKQLVGADLSRSIYEIQ